ncbi:MAG: beta-ketoacyl-[acyl-carrier-protein] synthase family protein [Verrucomicrobiota bacterium]
MSAQWLGNPDASCLPRQSNAKRRVVVTGMGVVSPIGCSVDAFWDGLLQGRCGIGPITLFDASGYPCPYAAEVKDFDPAKIVEAKRVRTLSRPTLFGLGAAFECLENAGWHSAPGDGVCGIVGGTSNTAQAAVEDGVLLTNAAGFKATRKLWYTLTKAFPHSMASEIGRKSGFQAKALTVSTACTAGMNAITQASELIRSGECDAVLVPSADATITKNLYPYFYRVKMLADSNLPPERISRPFDAKRSGGILGEGAGCLLLEERDHACRRNAPQLCEILGSGSSGTGFAECGDEQAAVYGTAVTIREALADAGVSPESVNYIGCHGVSDPDLDRLETRAIKQAFGEDAARRIPMSSIKALTGIPQSAAGMMQVIATVLAIRDGVLPPTMNYEYADPDCDLDYVPNKARRNQVRRALAWCHGFNGSDAAVVLGAL